MKKLTQSILVAALAALAFIAVPAKAQNTWPVAKNDSFLTVSSVIISNLVNITNIAYPGLASPTNVAGVTYTNGLTRYVTSSTVGTNKNLLGMVPLYPHLDGSPKLLTFGTTNTMNYLTAVAAPSEMNISLTTLAGSGADSAITLVFAPVWDGVNIDTTGGFDFSFTFTPTVSALQTMHTNVPAGRWLGAKALACKSVGIADTTASSQVAVLALKLNSWASP